MNQLGSLIPLILLLGVMYFVLIRPQQQRVKAQRALVTSLSVGDEVVTIGGLLGRIVTIDDETVTVETTPGTVLRYRRGAIASRVGLSGDGHGAGQERPTDDGPVGGDAG